MNLWTKVQQNAWGGLGLADQQEPALRFEILALLHGQMNSG
jgi:hypothetical protein